MSEPESTRPEDEHTNRDITAGDEPLGTSVPEDKPLGAAVPGDEPLGIAVPGDAPAQSEDNSKPDAEASQAETTQAPTHSERARSRRLPTPLHSLIYGLRLLLMGLCLSILSVVALLWQPPEYLLDWVARDVEKLLLDNAGLPLRIGRISLLEVRLNHQRLELQNIYLYGHRDATIPFAVAPHATLETDLLAYLLKRPQVTLINLASPQLRVLRDSEGQINFRPEIKESPPDPDAPPLDLPYAKLTVKDMVVMIRNESDDFKISDHVHLNFANADLDQARQALIYGNLRTDLFSFWGKSKIAIDVGLGWATGKLASVDLDNLNEYTRMVRDLNFQQGAFRGELWANWDDWSMLDLRYSGKLWLDHVMADVPFFGRPVIATGLVLLDQNKVSLERLQLETANSVLRARGWITDYLDQPRMDLRLTSQQLDIGPLLRGIQLKDIQPLLAMRPEGL
ncbi:MAG: hypothetical protein CVV27_12865, partial [Candidatus Melainabacteria bacterium HGW-Melainabacteria-1]